MRHFFLFFNAFCLIAAFYETVFLVLAEVLSHRQGTARFYETLFPFFNAFCLIAAFYETVFCVLAEVLSHRQGTVRFYETFFPFFQCILSHSGFL
jgi:hypothetical protein